MRLAISSLVGSRPQFLHQLARGADELVDGLDHVHRNAYGAGLVGDGAGNSLPDPPRGIGRELVAAAVLELVHGLHQADIAFLNQVQKLQAAVWCIFRDRNHQPQVGLDQLALGLLGIEVAARMTWRLRLSSCTEPPAWVSICSICSRIWRCSF